MVLRESPVYDGPVYVSPNKAQLPDGAIAEVCHVTNTIVNSGTLVEGIAGIVNPLLATVGDTAGP